MIPDLEKKLNYRDILSIQATDTPKIKRIDKRANRYWLKATIRNVDADTDISLVIPGTRMDIVHLFVVKNGQLLHESLQGQRVWAESGEIRDIHPTITAPLDLTPGEEATVVIQYENKLFHRLDATVLTTSMATKQNIIKTIVIVLSLGLIAFLTVYNLIIGIALKRIAYFWYAVHAVSYLYFFLYVFGYMAKFFGMAQEYIIYYQLTPVAGLLFVYYFFELKKFSKSLSLVFRILIGLGVIQVFIVPWLEVQVYYRMLQFEYMLYGPVIIYTTIRAIQNGFKAAWFVLIGWIGISISLAWAVLFQMGYLVSYYMLREVLISSVALDMLLLSFAMTYHLRRLEIEKLNLQRQDEIQNRFIATLSHEVRTPLSAIIASVSRAIEQKVPDRNRLLEDVKDTGEALLSMVDNLLLFTKTKSNVVQTEVAAFDIRRLLKSVVTLFTERAQDNHVKIKTEISPQTPSSLIGDNVLLRQIVINLLSNAIKNTRNGHVTISIEPIYFQGARCQLSIEIKDTGRGIDEEEQKRIFGQFYQVDGSPSAPGSAGMGLYIVSELVNAMHGKLTLNSKVGVGTKVVITLPFTVDLDGARAKAVEKALEEFSGSTVLLVEDEPNVSQLLYETMRRRGIFVVDVSSAQDALEQIDLLQPDLILTDLHLPDMSGVTLIQKIKDKVGQNRVSIPIIVMTASTDIALHNQIEGSDVAETLIKPVDSGRLVEILHRHLSKIGVDTSKTVSGELLNDEVIVAHRHTLGVDTFSSLLNRYSESVTLYLNEMEEAIGKLDRERIEYLAHKIAGLASSLGLQGVAQYAGKVEHEAVVLDNVSLSQLHKSILQANHDGLREITSEYLC